MKRLVFLFSWLIALSCKNTNTAKPEAGNHSSADMANFYLTLPQTMNDMVNRMKAIPFSGNNDRDFASLMREYYDGAIDIARLQFAHGKQKDLKAFSQATIKDLKQELLVLSNFLKDEPTEKSSSAQMFQRAIKNALSQIPADNSLHGRETDHLFVQLMINHHKAGLQLLRAELEYGAHQTMKIDARNRLAKQAEEIKWLQSWLSKN
ncbi:MAG: DUF305 domain-containing protein [Williamsia sp.]|nr:DUF305 domain-containing protein [Williamsia sp.]